MKAGISLSYDPKSVPKELIPLLKNLSEEYPLSAKNKSGITLDFVKIDDPKTVRVSLKGKAAIIKYGQLSLAARGISSLFSGLVKNNSELSETLPFSTFGIMLDCSRNAVMTVEHFKNWLRRLALMGYNMAMLYTEDTFEVEGEAFFGLFRGAYSQEELKEIDSYASELGIEMIPCIQTLGHLAQVLKWPAYKKIMDTTDILLANSKDTYDFIENIIKQCAASFKARRINIGMDEADDLGNGKYRKQFGEKSQFDIFNQHLAKVIEICRKHGYEKPMIWSDMYFRMGSKTHDYYDIEAKIPDSVKKQIPSNVELGYWDYEHADKNFYSDFIKRHRALGFNPIVVSGIHTWGVFWHRHDLTEKHAGPCIESCIEEKIDEIIFTMWGDDGAYCNFDSAFSGLAWCAEKAIYANLTSEAALEKRFNAICKSSYKGKILPDSEICKPILFWDDPILNIKSILLASNFMKTAKTLPAAIREIDKWRAKIDKISAGLEKYRKEKGALNAAHVINTLNCMSGRMKLFTELICAYETKDKKLLRTALRTTDCNIKAFKKFNASFRIQWLARNKPFGLELIQIRNAGIIARLNELKTRLAELLTGKQKSIPELDTVLKTLHSIENGTLKYEILNTYRSTATSSAIF